MSAAHLHRIDRPDRPDGFTFSELALVLVFVAGLLTVIFVSVANIEGETSQSNCQSDLRTLKLATEQYRAQNDVYPPDKASLIDSGLVNADQVRRWSVDGGGNPRTEPVYRPLDSSCT